MEAEKNPDYLRQLSERVREFRTEFEFFLRCCEINNAQPFTLGARLAAVNITVDESQAREITERVNVAAGNLMNVGKVTGVRVHVQDRGDIDPFAEWQTITKPMSVLRPEDILGACDQALGRIEGLLARAEADAPPTVGVAQMHPAVWGQAARLWRDGHYRQAVAAGADGAIQLVKSRTGRNDIPDTSQWQQAFSSDPPQPGRPRLRWPGDQTDQTVKSMNEGLRQFAPGTQMTIRNPATHQPGEMSEQEASERLAVLSLLARWVDECDLVEAADPAAGGGGAAT